MRRKIVETGDVDVMIAIRSNFFYTRTVPCELWHFDRGKPEDRRDKVLMIDARNIYRKVTRKIYDFSPEHLARITAIVWLYRGQQDRFLGLVREYFTRICVETRAITEALNAFESSLETMRKQLSSFVDAVKDLKSVTPEQKQPLIGAMTELEEGGKAYATDRSSLLRQLTAFRAQCEKSLPRTNVAQHAARQAFDPSAVGLKGLAKQVDLLHKLTARVGQLAQGLAGVNGLAELYDRRALNKQLKHLDEERKSAVEELKAATYFHRQIVWLQDRFPDATIQDVAGLCKVATRADIQAADWSLTPGRYVGVAPSEVDEDFDFEQTLRDIHVELASKVQENFERLEI